MSTLVFKKYSLTVRGLFGIVLGMRKLEARIQQEWYLFVSGMLIVSVPVGVAFGLYTYFWAEYTHISSLVFGLLIPTFVFMMWWNTEIRWQKRINFIKRMITK